MKKRILILTAIAVTICVFATAFVGCSQSEEDYYAEIEQGVSEFASKYDEILTNLKAANFSASFSVERHFNAAMSRGSEESKGWDQFEKVYNELYDTFAPDNNFIEDLLGKKSEEQEKIDALGMETNGWYDQYAVVEYVQNGSDDFYFKSVTYEPVWEKFYEDFRSALDDEKKLAELKQNAAEEASARYRYEVIKDTIDNPVVVEVRTTGGETTISINGQVVDSEPITDGLTLLEDFGVRDGEFAAEDLVGFSNGNKIYTHVMQAQYRTVYALPETQPVLEFPQAPSLEDATIEEVIPGYLEELAAIVSDWQDGLDVYFDPALRVGIEDNADGTYWSGYDEDISYEWKEIGAMYTARYTYDYNNKHGRLEQVDYYTERIMPYYTENNAIDSTLVLKADVFDNTHLVIDFVYPEEGKTIEVPSIG